MPNIRRLIWPVILSLILAALISVVPGQLAESGVEAKIVRWTSQGLFTLLWFVGASLFNRLLEIFVWNGLVRTAINREPPRLVVQLLAVAVYLVAFGGVMAFVFGNDVTAFWATSGAVGIIIGLALQNLILDTFSGLAIHLERPFKVGDWINVHTRMGEFIGRVEETNWRTTRLWTTSRNIVIVPNSFMTTTIVVNFSLPNQVARFELEFLMDFFVPTDRVIRVLTTAVKSAIGATGPLADPPPKVRVDEVTEDGILYKVRYYLDPERVSPAKARNTVLGKVMLHLNHSGLSLTYPKRDVYMTNMPWRQKEWGYQKDLVRQLRGISLFRTLSEEDLVFISEEMKVHDIRAGQRIVSEGADGDSMYVVAEGLLAVSINTEQGDDVEVAVLEPGDFFGEKSLLTGEPRSANVICVYDAIVGEITNDAISRLIKNRPEVASLLSVAMAKREVENTSALEQSLSGEDEAIETQAGKILANLKNFFNLG